VSGGGGKFGGLSGWVVVGDGVVIVVVGSIISVVGRRGRSELSVIGLTFGSVGVAGVKSVVVEVGECGGGECGGVVSEEGGGGVGVGSSGFDSEGSLFEFFRL